MSHAAPAKRCGGLSQAAHRSRIARPPAPALPAHGIGTEKDNKKLKMHPTASCRSALPTALVSEGVNVLFLNVFLCIKFNKDSSLKEMKCIFNIRI